MNSVCGLTFSLCALKPTASPCYVPCFDTFHSLYRASLQTHSAFQSLGIRTITRSAVVRYSAMLTDALTG